ncbi:MAG: tRNA 2-thiouridine(34) synthase MnmA [Termitinemataceae bacterium]|nr:MAG: tRNA 2-thiouridine(34) synthase MnmA [Termitinemataceae bacterium]
MSDKNIAGGKKKKALIAMSGGVDSSVAAYLMLQNDFDCIGATMKLFNSESRCCSLQDVNDARDVAYKLGMPHYVVNLSAQFEKYVIDKFIKVYEDGGTPNPCIDCNRFVKFNTLLLRAHQLEYDYLVTGHYAQIEKKGSRFLLKKALDTKKDQSYVLYTMTQSQLSETFFPLGALTKDDVRIIAGQQQFINAKKKDSQDICFVSDGDYAAFIESRLNKKYSEGSVLDFSGNVIGKHNGHVRYTIGQRRGLGLSFPMPMYVCAKSAKDNTVTLGSEEHLFSKTLEAADLNLIVYEAIEEPIKVMVKTRYMQKEQPAVIEQIEPDKIRIEFNSPQKSITKGQAAVFYDGEYVVGGGTIL